MTSRDVESIRWPKTHRVPGTVLGLVALAVLGGCASIVGQPPPTMAHVHIGHTLTGWPATPDKRGLLQIAEDEAAIALAGALRATRAGDPAQTRQAVRDVMHALDPASQSRGPGHGYGLRRAVTDAVSHLGYASESPDSSGNLVRSMQQVAPRSAQIVDRCEQILLFGQAIAESTSSEEIDALADEILTLIRLIADGDAGPNKGHYGLVQLRRDVESMVGRETPAYETVNSWYLFNLVRTPNGEWEFATDDVAPGARRY